jgi:hypothetical protein
MNTIVLDIIGFGSLIIGAITFRYLQPIIGMVLIFTAIGILILARYISSKKL